MLRTCLLLAGLGAALVAASLSSDSGRAAPPPEAYWVEHHVQGIVPGQAYRLDGCLTVIGEGVQVVSLRAIWHAGLDGAGKTVWQDDAPASADIVGLDQCLTMDPLHAPCAARSVRFGVFVFGATGAVTASTVELSPAPSTPPATCPTPMPAPTPTPSPGATPAPRPTPTPGPTPAAAPSAPVEPPSFPTLVNGGFEQLREDGTPYGWHKIGGEMTSTGARHAEGRRAAALISRTESTKWLYQTVAVEGGTYYRLSARALKDDPAAREALVRISWYASDDGSGSQLSTDDSEPLTGSVPEFVPLDTGAVLAPPEARSARLRLMLRPASSARATVFFDDVRFSETVAPAASGSREGQAASNVTRTAATAGVSRPPQAGSLALSVWAGPTPLANDRRPANAAQPSDGGGRPLWPFLLALAAPAVGLPLLALGARRSGAPTESQR